MNFIYNPLYKFGFQINGASVSFKEVVPTYNDLPLVGNIISDARITEDTGHLYIWNGTSWVDQGIFTNINWSAIDGKPVSTPTEIDTSVNLSATALQPSIIDTDIHLTADSDNKIPSQKAVKSYVDTHMNIWHLETLPPIFNNNAAAILGGLVPGDLYRTGHSIDVLCVVH